MLLDQYKQVENPSEASATVNFDKLFEIEGLLSEIKPQKDRSSEPKSSDKNKGKTEQSKKSKEKPIKTPKNSDELTEEEVEAIGRAFKLSQGIRFYFILFPVTLTNPKTVKRWVAHRLSRTANSYRTTSQSTCKRYDRLR